MSRRAPLLLLGAGGLGREAAAVVRELAGEPFEIIGFLDDDPGRHGTLVAGHEVLGPVSAIADYPDAYVVASIGRHREHVVDAAGTSEDRWATLIHPAVSLSSSTTVGHGSIILAQCVATADVAIGRHVVVMPHVSLTHDVVVEDYVTLAAGSRLSGFVRAERGAYVGTGALIRESVTIGADSTLGMGAVATRCIPRGQTWMGVPARPRISPSEAQIPLVDLVAAHAELADCVMPAVEDVIQRAAFVGGPEVAEFEEAYADFSGADQCIGVANGTDALEIALRATGIGQGDEVVVPGNSFAATAEAVMRAGAFPVFADVTPDGLLDPDAVGDAITDRTAAMIPVHLYGQLAEMEALESIAQARGLVIIEDAAQCQGALRHGRPAGSWGSAAATSFYPGKNLGAYGDAGAIVTDDGDVAVAARLIANHGAARRYHHDVLGFNSRLDTIQAAVLAQRLRWLHRWNSRRRAAADHYSRLLEGIDGVVRPRELPGNHHVWHLYVIQVDDRDRVLQVLNSEGIGAAIHYPIPLHRQRAFAGTHRPLVTVEALAGRILSLPLSPHISPRQQERVVEVLARAVS